MPSGRYVHRGEPLKSLLRRSITPVVARVYRFQPVRNWPRWAGDLLEVKTPANVTHKTALSPAGEPMPITMDNYAKHFIQKHA
jgi:hypothetical protein